MTDRKTYCRERQRERRRDPLERERDRQRAQTYRKANQKQILTKLRIRKWSKFGGTIALFKQRWKEQKGKCGICNRRLTFDYSKRITHPQFDHCHDSLRPRGILCMHCNTKLDWYIEFKEEIEIYLERYK